MIRLLVFGLLAFGTSSPAVALSCLRPDVAKTYTQAAQAEEKYVVVHGDLSFDAARLPRAEGNESPELTRIPARLKGHALSKSGFDHAFDREITLEVACFGPWCGGAAPNHPYLAFVMYDDNAGYTLSIDPCGGMVFPDPTAEILDKVQRCNRGGTCK